MKGSIEVSAVEIKKVLIVYNIDKMSIQTTGISKSNVLNQIPKPHLTSSIH
jgi:hypothetical protein